MIDPVAIWKAFCPGYAGGAVAPVQAPRDAQVTVVPAPYGQAVRFEVKHGDVYKTYSDARALITGPAEMWEDEGNERWYRWRPMWPVGWVGSYPKWDQPGARSPAGSSLEWHHEPFGGGVESGSAPLYIGADDSTVWLHLVDQATSEVRKALTLVNLVRGKWYDFVFHIKWSSKAGLIEVWESGTQVLTLVDQTMYPQTRMYPCAGLYRNGHIGENDASGLPAFCFAGGFARGLTRASVEGGISVPTPPVTPTPPSAPVPGDIMLLRDGAETIRATLVEMAGVVLVLEDEATKIRDYCNALLDRGKW